jgi:Trk K+ transport system NAD-binding subunit
VARVNRTGGDLVTDRVSASVTTAKTATTIVSVTAAAETTGTIAVMAETASPRVTTRLTLSSLLRPPQRTARWIKTVSSPSARDVDADVAVANVTTIGRQMKRPRAQPRAPQTMKLPQRPQSLVVSRIDDGPLTGATKDGADVSDRPLNQRSLQLR